MQTKKIATGALGRQESKPSSAGGRPRRPKGKKGILWRKPILKD